MARNCVERIFVIVKRRFRILSISPEYSVQVQAKLVLAVCALHNFIRSYDPEDGVAYDTEEIIREVTQPEAEQFGTRITREESEEASQRRDEIAHAMWAQYQEYLQANNM